ncbi:hypothetical protein BpHYR1_037481 [Brachionus plicatilis]|uniref:Uncharacterized protein n=1 Tax=Brachionus plicatilis TaxID=10195 RepID=A0A3M7Q5A9_BRAPC|nr:hypothetical protein BpHYR1_037481 [Brachionus plicatilis]
MPKLCTRTKLTQNVYNEAKSMIDKHERYNEISPLVRIDVKFCVKNLNYHPQRPKRPNSCLLINCCSNYEGLIEFKFITKGNIIDKLELTAFQGNKSQYISGQNDLTFLSNSSSLKLIATRSDSENISLIRQCSKNKYLSNLFEEICSNLAPHADNGQFLNLLNRQAV